MVGATEEMKILPPFGYFDEPIAVDDKRIAYVVSDTATKSELHVVWLGCAACVAQHQEIVADLSPVTLKPVGLRLVGNRAFVIGATDDGNQIAALVELGPMPPVVAPLAPPAPNAAAPAAAPAAGAAGAAGAVAAVPTPAAAKPAKAARKGKAPGSVVYKLGPATNITVVTRDKQTRVAVHNATPTATGGVKHTVDLVAIETGRRIARGKAFELDGARNKKLELKVNHWMDGYTRVGGIKDGEWVKKERQRSPDTEAVYDLVSGKIVEKKAITNLFEQRKRFQVLADAGGRASFLKMAWDNQSIQLWKSGVEKTLELDQPINHYDVASLQGIVMPDGGAWFALEIDPVNVDAVARKKADPEYLDVFRAGPDGKAVRQARVLAKGVKYEFGPAGEKAFWLVQKSPGFDRGGTKLATYTIAP